MTSVYVTFISWSIALLALSFILFASFVFDNWQLSLFGAAVTYFMPFGGAWIAGLITWPTNTFRKKRFEF